MFILVLKCLQNDDNTSILVYDYYTGKNRLFNTYVVNTCIYDLITLLGGVVCVHIITVP